MSWRTSSTPPSFGMRRSARMSPNGLVRAHATASRPSAAATTRYPALENIFTRALRRDWSSSTTRIVCGIVSGPEDRKTGNTKDCDCRPGESTNLHCAASLTGGGVPLKDAPSMQQQPSVPRPHPHHCLHCRASNVRPRSTRACCRTLAGTRRVHATTPEHLP